MRTTLLRVLILSAIVFANPESLVEILPHRPYMAD